MSRDRWGKTWSGAGLVVRGFGPSAATPIRGISPLHPLAIDGDSLYPQHRHQPPRAEKWPGHEQLVDPPHQRQIIAILGRQRALNSRSCHPEHAALAADRNLRMAAVEHRFPVRRAHPRIEILCGRVTVSLSSTRQPLGRD
jgi:hypothetical protein